MCLTTYTFQGWLLFQERSHPSNMQRLKIQAFSDVILYRWASSARRFARSQRLLLQGQAVQEEWNFTYNLFVSSLHFEFKTDQMLFPSNLKYVSLHLLYLLNGLYRENIAERRSPCIPNMKQEVQHLCLKSATSVCTISKNLNYLKL